MQVNQVAASETYYEYKTTSKTKTTSTFTYSENQTKEGIETTVSRESTYSFETHQEILSSAVKEIPTNYGENNMKSLGMGFLLVGDYGYGMSATQLQTDTDDIMVRVKIAKGNNQYDTVDVNLSKLDTKKATAVEMFAYCQYADANGTDVAGTNSMFGSWNALKSIISPYDGMNFNSYEDAVNTKRNWDDALVKSTTVLERKSTGERITVSDIIEMLRKNSELTASNIDEKDWRYMSDKDWDRLLSDLDNYVEDVNEQMEQMKKLQEEAAMKAASNAPVEMRTIAASNAAVQAAANGFYSGTETRSSSWIEENSWTYDLQTDEQEILAKAKAVNDMAKDALSKTQEILLMGDTVTGISDTENLKECASLSEEKEKTWIITAFGADGIICKECKVGKESRELWRIDYKNKSDAKKVWDFIERFGKDDDLKFAGNKNFWEDFLADKVDF